MAEKGLDSDYSGRPVRRFTEEEIAAADTSGLPVYDVVVVLDDGREAARIDGKLYPLDEEGIPDYENPIDEP
ncbi:hypothetical protein [Sediminispirochaeta bajacaliforniensis]|uniref:hypothetical protein n=1 Tax=Sediminispirochaeta bajacaliforniensis TaxID=148 RepID=UPI00036A205B|nr:hypothetical protein [Sediminispirochaeta bajacaliforniensis]